MSVARFALRNGSSFGFWFMRDSFGAAAPIRRSVCPKQTASLHRALSELRFCLLAFALMLLVSSNCGGQTKFSPDDAAVQKIAERAVAALEKKRSDDAGELALGALAVVECSKRYTLSVPRNSPTVKKAIKRILADLPKKEDESGGPLAGAPETYYPAMALILLCEYDDQKYEKEIELLIRILMKRQQIHGGFAYTRAPSVGDTSQIQYAALAMFVARQHRFFIKPEAAKSALLWLTGTQKQGGTFYYKLKTANPLTASRPSPGLTPTPSIQSAGIGTVYLLESLLQLGGRRKSGGGNAAQTLEAQALNLPPGVSVYVKPRSDKDKELEKEGPLVSFDRGLLGRSKSTGDGAMEKMYAMPIKQWQYYYLYALERYAYFREQRKGGMGGGKMKNWYDDGVYYLKNAQTKDGGYPRGFDPIANDYINTAFAILFLVRSSEILVQPAADSTMQGGQGFKADATLVEKGGKIQANSQQQNLDEMMEMMSKDSLDDGDLEQLANSMRRAMQEFRTKDAKDRGNVETFLRTMISDRNYYRRLIAVRFLAGEQDLDNVPALLYALTDPDFRIAYEAHNGLRLISRKIDSIRLSPTAVPPVADDEETRKRVQLEYLQVKDQWQKWYLELRPNAKLLD